MRVGLRGRLRVELGLGQGLGLGLGLGQGWAAYAEPRCPLVPC